MGDNSGNGGNNGNDPIPFAAEIQMETSKKKENIVPVAIAAFVGALAGAVIGSQLG